MYGRKKRVGAKIGGQRKVTGKIGCNSQKGKGNPGLSQQSVSERVVVENNFLSSKEARQFDEELVECKASGGDCKSVVQKYLEISNKNSKELAEACTGGGVACVTWEELIQGSTNVANDPHSGQFRLDEKLKDPDAAATSAGYATGNVLKVPFDKKLNSILKQYEWIPTGVWTITKPAPQHPLPSIMGNVGDSAVSGMVQDKLKDSGGK